MDETQRLHDILKKRFGFDSFRGAQLDIVHHVTQGSDAMVVMPTPPLMSAS